MGANGLDWTEQIDCNWVVTHVFSDERLEQRVSCFECVL